MAKKPTWIKVHSNILEPKHQKAIGERIWLFLYLIDNADWKTGIVPEYTDADAARDLGRSKRTIERWRSDLIKGGYIACKQIQHGQEVTINRWRNPQHVNSEPINIPAEGTQICREKKVQGTQQGTQQGRQKRVPSQAQNEHATQYTIHNTSSKEDGTKPAKPDSNHPALQAYREIVHRYPHKSWWQDIIDQIGDSELAVQRWQALVKDWAGHGWNMQNVKDMLSAFEKGGIRRDAPRQTDDPLANTKGIVAFPVPPSAAPSDPLATVKGLEHVQQRKSA
jgi:hypothetical protein